MNLNTSINEINKALAYKGTKIRIENRRGILNLRGPLPCKKDKDLLKVQRLSLQIPANDKGLIKAENLLNLLLLQLEHNQFNWNNWKKDKKEKEPREKNSLIEEIGKFEEQFFKDPLRCNSKSSSQTTWNSAYKPYLRRLKEIGTGQKNELNVNLFCKALLSYEQNSRSRQQCSSSLSVFARYLNLKLPDNWRKMGSGYGLQKYRFRELPTEKTIKRSLDLIPNDQWRLVYGLMACYGLRNHEVFFSDLSCISKEGDHILRVLPNTKTGEHQVWPFHPEWVDFFDLYELNKHSQALPKINTDLSKTSLQKVGRRVSEQFRRYNLPLTPYDLRHAWAIRTIHIGLPDTVSARMMGHSVSIHTRTYHHWITRRDQQKAVDAALAKNTY
tara:strand:+ start:19039 stop:20196 length:1158 start_codon:yes stop_codon:yes gene_type:complete